MQVTKLGRLLLAATAAAFIGAGMTPAASAAPATPAKTPAVSAARFEVLQMNLCRSGKAKCFNKDGNSPRPHALKRIQKTRPNIVTLNEVCLPEVYTLLNDLSHAYTMTWKSAGKRVNGTTKVNHCVDPKTGKDRGRFGIAVLAKKDGSVGSVKKIRRGLYPERAQDPGSTERRAWLCVQYTRVNACTTHLATSRSTALDQCLRMKTTIAELGRGNATVLGADLNLRYKKDDHYNVQKCVPSTFFRKGFTYPGGTPEVNHIMASSKHFSFRKATPHFIPGTDHKAFAVDLNRK